MILMAKVVSKKTSVPQGSNDCVSLSIAAALMLTEVLNMFNGRAFRL